MDEARARNTAARLRRLGSCIVALLAWSAPSTARAEETAERGEPRDPPCPPSVERRLLAGGAAIVPGILVHGAGHYALCETTTAQRLALIEGVGVASAVGSGVGLALTGASRYVVAPLALGAIAGVGTFGLTLLADVYGIAATGSTPGAATPPPRLALETGLRAVHDRHFDGSWFASHGFGLDLGAVQLAPRLDLALDAPVYRYALSGAYRLIGARPGDAATHGDALELGLTLWDVAYSKEGFASTTLDLFVAGRLDLARIGPTLRGSFVDGLAGYARQWTRFDGLPGDATDELLARFAFGIYLGGSGGFSGESWVAYDHRRDTFAGGLLLPGIPAGYMGYVEQRSELFFGGPFGVATELSYGSAFVASVYFLARIDEEHRP